MPQEKSISRKRITAYIMDFFSDDQEAFLKYQALVAPMFQLEAELELPFQSTSKVYLLNDITFSSSAANTHHARFGRSEETIRQSGLNHFTLLLYKDSPYQCLIEGEVKEIPPDSLLLIDMSRPIELHVKDVHNLSVNLPRNYFENMMLATDGLHGMVINSGPHYTLLLSYLNSLENVAGEILAKDAHSVCQTMVTMIGDCIRQGLQRKSVKFSVNSRVLIQDVKKLIDQHIIDPELNVDWLTRKFNISRATLYRLFGTTQSVADYIQGRKLEYAYQQLSDVTKRNISMTRLSETLGYSHPSAFSRAFFEKFGVRPSKVKTQEAGRSTDILPWRVNLDVDAHRLDY